jgi:nucleotide-binding universal stress UspA family protein
MGRNRSRNAKMDRERSKKMLQRIVVPLDGSARAAQALPLAARLARASQGSLLLVRVVAPSRELVLEAGEAAPLLSDSTQEELAKARRSLETVAAAPQLAGIAVATEVITGHPAKGIVSLVEEKQTDLIVLCSHGYTGVKRWVVGSVAQQVARHSAVPALILREETTPPATSLAKEGHAVRMMVALDGSALAETVLTPAAYVSAALSAPHPGALHLVRILRLSTAFEYGQDDSFARARTERTREAQAYLRTVENRCHEGELARLHLKVTSSVDYDLDVAQRLLVLAEQDIIEDGVIGCDMMALVTHARSGVARWAMGSVAERVLGATSLPLLIVRPGNEQFLAKAQHGAPAAPVEEQHA